MTRQVAPERQQPPKRKARARRPGAGVGARVTAFCRRTGGDKQTRRQAHVEEHITSVCVAGLDIFWLSVLVFSYLIPRVDHGLDGGAVRVGGGRADVRGGLRRRARRGDARRLHPVGAAAGNGEVSAKRQNQLRPTKVYSPHAGARTKPRARVQRETEGEAEAEAAAETQKRARRGDARCPHPLRAQGSRLAWANDTPTKTLPEVRSKLRAGNASRGVVAGARVAVGPTSDAPLPMLRWW